jgi:hypothetical protein
MARPNFALASATYPNVNSAYKRGAFLQVVLTFASGVPTIDEARSAPGFTIAGDTGAYTGTAPTAERGIFLIQPLTATADAIATVTSYVPSTGVFAFKVAGDDGNALDVATGDEVFLLFLLEGG